MTQRTPHKELDGLRLIGLGRVPACSKCPRYRDLVNRYLDETQRSHALAPVPVTCEHAYCAPLADRYEWQQTVPLPRCAVG